MGFHLQRNQMYLRWEPTVSILHRCTVIDIFLFLLFLFFLKVLYKLVQFESVSEISFRIIVIHVLFDYIDQFVFQQALIMRPTMLNKALRGVGRKKGLDQVQLVAVQKFFVSYFLVLIVK